MPQTAHKRRTETKDSTLVVTLGSVGTIAAFLIVVSFHLTLARIERQEKESLEASVYKVLSGTANIQPYRVTREGKLVKSDGKDKGKTYVYAGYDREGRLVGVAVQAVGQGFQDKISLVYGYSHDRQCIVGIDVLAHKETPGLGDKIKKDEAFLANFKSLDMSWDMANRKFVHPLKVVKQRKGEKMSWEIDAITGATISSKAIGKILSESVAIMSPIILAEENLETLKERK